MSLLMVLLAMASASAQEVSDDTCGAIWEDYFNAGVDSDAEPTGSALFRAADALGSLGKRKKSSVAVLSCAAGEPHTSTVVNWGGETRYDANGHPIVQGYCTEVDVVEAQGRRLDRCRRFPSSRICQHVDDPNRILVAVGTSRPVTCPNRTEDDAGQVGS